jgi:hypothetical protein
LITEGALDTINDNQSAGGNLISFENVEQGGIELANLANNVPGSPTRNEGARVRVIRADWQGMVAHLGLIALIAKCNYVGENCCVF